MASEDVQTNLRLPSDLKDKLQASAEEHGRSLSAEVAYRIEQAFELEIQEAESVANIRAAKEIVQKAHAQLDSKEIEVDMLRKHLSNLEGRAEVLNNTRESDIAAATKHLNVQIDGLVARLGSAEQESEALKLALDAQQQTIRLLGFGLMQISNAQDGDTSEVLNLKGALRQVAICISNGDLKAAAVRASDVAASMPPA